MIKHLTKVSLICLVAILFAGCELKDKYPIYRITTGSMLPTFEVGRAIIVNSSIDSLAYGDIVTYRVDSSVIAERDLYISHKDVFTSRIVGLPGDHIGVEDNTPVVNGKKCETKFIRKTDVPFDPNYYVFIYFDEYSETLPNGKIISLYKADFGQPNPGDWAPVIILADDEYFIMGDSRSNCFDSRHAGPIKRKDITGKIINYKE